MKNLVQQLKALEPKMVCELNLGENSVFEIDDLQTPKTEEGKLIYEELKKQFNSRKRVYIGITPSKKKYSKDGRKYVEGGYHDKTGYRYTIDSLMIEDENNFYFAD